MVEDKYFRVNSDEKKIAVHGTSVWQFLTENYKVSMLFLKVLIFFKLDTGSNTLNSQGEGFSLGGGNYTQSVVQGTLVRSISFTLQNHNWKYFETFKSTWWVRKWGRWRMGRINDAYCFWKDYLADSEIAWHFSCQIHYKNSVIWNNTEFQE